MLGWQDIHAEALRRIQSREWPPGGVIPKEADLARELGVARATVNRALRSLAEDGWLERKRRAGTTVALSPQRRAQMSVPVLRHQIEATGATYSCTLLHRSVANGVLTCQSLHLADQTPFSVEDRQVNLVTVPSIETVSFEGISANEWLVQNAPFSHGSMRYEAEAANAFESVNLQCPEGAALMILYRETHSDVDWITRVRMAFRPGHMVNLDI